MYTIYQRVNKPILVHPFYLASRHECMLVIAIVSKLSSCKFCNFSDDEAMDKAFKNNDKNVENQLIKSPSSQEVKALAKTYSGTSLCDKGVNIFPCL